MIVPARNLILLLLVSAFLAGTIPPQAASVASDAAPVSDGCCGGEAEGCLPSTAVATEEPLSDDDCCPNGCTECDLACCGGPVSVLPLLPTVGTRQPLHGLLPANGVDFTSLDRSRIYHPPRA